MTGLPAFKVEIDADPDVTGLFVLDVSHLDGTDVLAEDVRYVALPADDVREIAIRRGRARDDQANDVGTATIVLDAWSGDYDPDNDGGPYRYLGQKLLRQGMQTRVSVTMAGVDHVLFTGSLETTAAGFGVEPTMTWTCVDLLARLGNAAFPPSETFVRDGDTSEERIGWLLSYDSAYADRVVTAGGRVLTGTQGGGTVLSNLESVARSEWGRVYADRDNVLTITHHADEYERTTDLVISDSAVDTGDDVFLETFADLFPGLAALAPSDMQVEPGLSLVVNRAILTRRGEVEETFAEEDDLSVERFGKRTQSAEVLLSNDSEARELAAYLASRRAVPTPWVSSVTVPLAGYGNTAWASVADLDLGAWVAVERTTVDGRELLWRVTAEGIDHSITTTGWTLTLATAPTDLASLFGSAGWFTLDVSTLDGADVLAAF
jgi:hypothetical protein